MEIEKAIVDGNTALGIELGSTRIKAVLIDDNHITISSGYHEWENRYENNIWTYTIEDIWSGIQACYRNLKIDVENKYGIKLTRIGSIGFSAMMHGYIAVDENDALLVPFRTWRNTTTGEAADKLTCKFSFNIPQRWSIAHLYQAILNKETHVTNIDYLTTLAGYVHWKLTGEKVLGAGDASGMFPLDSKKCDYNAGMIAGFDELVEPCGYAWKLTDILPKVLPAGESAGYLTQEGAKLLDLSGELAAGIPVCPPEGDAGTGMTATNSVAVRTGNVSAGTSVFAMIVMEHALKNVHTQIDVVTTPEGTPVAMVHCNNCTSDLNAWVNLFQEFAESYGIPVDRNQLFSVLYNKALGGDKDCGGLVAYNYISGEPLTGFKEGCPLFARKAEDNFNLANFMRTHLYSSLATLKVGLDILFKEEDINVDKMCGHGGFFKTKEVGQKIMAAAMNTPISVMETAGEGGAWGIAILASYMKNKETEESLASYLENKVFAGVQGIQIIPDSEDVKGFDLFMKNYMNGLKIERAAVDSLRA